METQSKAKQNANWRSNS